MATPIPESWTRIETWLAWHAPRTFAALEPPAERSAIAAAEQVIGRPLPDALTESLLRHNGTGDYNLLLPCWMLLSTQIIVILRTTGASRDQVDGSISPEGKGRHGPENGRERRRC
ncbi:hypothetical protein [Streptomyces sp. NPDC003006]